MSKQQKTKKPETWWCIKNGELLLPYTARKLRRDCIAEWMHVRIGGELGTFNKVVKIRVVEVQR